jgi:hypothetical protein
MTTEIKEIPILDIEQVVEKALALEYNDGNNIIKDWASFANPITKNRLEIMLAGQIVLQKNKYIGLLDKNLVRQKVGIHHYENGDIYLGEWKDNKRHGHGVYLHNVTKQGKIVIEMNMGKWVDDVFDKEGVYIWMEEPKNNDDIMNCDFEAFVGEFETAKFKRGVYLTLLNKKFYIYYGKFTEGKKNDDCCYFYDNDLKIDRVFRGIIKEDVVQEGFFITFHKETIDDVVFLKFNEGRPEEVSSMKSIDPDNIKKIEQECLRFRESLYEDDWFGLIYEKAKEAYNLIQNFKLDDYNNEKKFKELVEVVGSYKKISLYPLVCKN